MTFAVQAATCAAGRFVAAEAAPVEARAKPPAATEAAAIVLMPNFVTRFIFATLLVTRNWMSQGSTGHG